MLKMKVARNEIRNAMDKRLGYFKLVKELMVCRM